MPWPPASLHTIYLSFAAYLTILLISYIRVKLDSPEDTTSGSTKSKHRLSGLYVLLSGSFSTKFPTSSALSVLWSILSFIVVVDFVHRGNLLHGNTQLAFSRVGYVGSTQARITIRYPSESAVHVNYRSEDKIEMGGWQSGPTVVPVLENDYLATFVFDNLQPDTAYQYRTNTSLEGSFHTSGLHPNKWSMISTSCIKPFFPYSPTDHSLRIKGLEYLSTYLDSRKVDFMLFLGDFIYVDLPVRFGFTPEHYRRLYRQVYASPSWSNTLLSLPWLHAYDDHEITNDWSGNETGIYKDAIESYMNYQHPANPDPVVSSGTYYTFQHGDVDFFVLDTRRYRSPGSMSDGPEKTMLGVIQREELERWLRKGKNWKVIVSSVPFTRNFRGPSLKDSWGGYLWERQRLLEKMWETAGVLIITGDRHEHATTSFPGPGTQSAEVIEFSTSPLNQFVQPVTQQLYSQVEDSDKAIYYHPAGQSKFGAFHFDTSNQSMWLMRFDLYVDGDQNWSYTVGSSIECEKPISTLDETALGSIWWRGWGKAYLGSQKSG